MGSTMMKALGFDALKAEKQHVNVYIKKASTRIPRRGEKVYRIQKRKQGACYKHISWFAPSSSETQMLFLL